MGLAASLFTGKDLKMNARTVGRSTTGKASSLWRTRAKTPMVPCSSSSRSHLLVAGLIFFRRKRARTPIVTLVGFFVVHRRSLYLYSGSLLLVASLFSSG